MDKGSWLTIVGLGEDGPEGLSSASRRAVAEAEIVIGPSRHLALLGETPGEQVAWPVPFADGREVLLGYRGRRTVALVSGDPFWFGAGASIAAWLDPGEWRALPGVSVFSLAASRLGWRLEDVRARAHHAAAFDGLTGELAPGRRFVVTLRDGEAVGGFAAWLAARGFGETELVVLEALGGPRERVRRVRASGYELADVVHPVAVAFEVAGDGAVRTCATGRPDSLFASDGQITKQPVRALTLSALAPRPGERLWDIGSGSGSIALEWLMSDRDTSAIAIEAREDRAATIGKNAQTLGLAHRDLRIVTGKAPEALVGLPAAHAVFIGGGLTPDLLAWLETHLTKGTRLVTNAVTLETQGLVTDAAARLGGSLLKLDISEAEPLGNFRSWRAARTLVQWSATL